MTIFRNWESKNVYAGTLVDENRTSLALNVENNNVHNLHESIFFMIKMAFKERCVKKGSGTSKRNPFDVFCKQHVGHAKLKYLKKGETSR